MKTTTTTKRPDEDAIEIIDRILGEITYHHEHRKVWAEPAGRSFTILAQLHKADTPRAIGGGGAHIKAMDSLCSLIAAKHGINMKMRVIEPEVGEPDRFAKFKPTENWDSAKVLSLAKTICEAVFMERVAVEIHEAKHFTSTIEIAPARSENMMLVRMVHEAMKTLFTAIGKANGRILYVDVASVHSEPTYA